MSDMPTLPLPLTTRLKRVRWLASTAILTERAWPAAKGPLLLLGLYSLAGLLRIPQRLPDTLHALLETGCLIAGVFWLRNGILRIRRPTETEQDRRIERASNLPYQPLLALSDTPAAQTSPLWPQHVERALKTLGHLRAGWPLPTLTRTDKSVAPLTLAALAIALGFAGSHAPSRLAAAFRPGWDDADVPLPQVQAWIDMPAYAPGAPLFLQDRSGNASLPEGSTLNATITGIADRPHATGADALSEKPLDRSSWSLHATLNTTGTLSLTGRGRTLARWNITVQPDNAPDVHWAAPPGKNDGFRTTFPWKAAQAYGLDTLTIELHHEGSTRVVHLPITLDGHPKDAHGETQLDLSADPWAGEKVTATLHARSTSGKDATSEPATLTLAARSFRDPMARAIIDLRRRLALGQEDRSTAAAELNALLDTPGFSTQRTGAYIALSSVASLLQNPDYDTATPDNTIAEAVGILWPLALYLEDLRHGSREDANAALDIRAAQGRVQSQLEHMRNLGNKGHTEQEQAELGRRTQELKDAINRRMQMLAERAMKNGSMIPNMGNDETGSADDEVQRMMRQMQSDAANGHGDDAMKRLQQMEDLAERMRNATPQDLATLAKQMQARQQMQAVHDLIRRETGLLDHTQSRLGAQTRAMQRQQQAQTDQGQNGDGDNDMGSIPTSELLRRLGLQPPPGMPQQPDQPTPPSDAALDDDARQAQHDQRTQDHAIQHALTRATKALSREVHDLTGKDAKDLKTAAEDMIKASKTLHEGADTETQAAEQKVIADLSQASKQMKQAMSQKAASQPVFLPGIGMGQGHDKAKPGQKGDNGDPAQADDDDDKSDRDPLGRHTGEGKDAQDSDTHLTDQQQKDRAREIEQELRRRDGDRTRSKDELDYLDRLLKSF